MIYVHIIHTFEGFSYQIETNRGSVRYSCMSRMDGIVQALNDIPSDLHHLIRWWHY